jgi:alanine-synthesizing transaminase
MARIVEWAERRDLWLISDLAYADIRWDGHRTPSALAVPGARERTVEFFTTSKSFNMAGWRCGFCVYVDYGIFNPIQQAAAAALDDGDAIAGAVRDLYRDRAAALVEGLTAAGWHVPPPSATMFVWAPIPEPFRASGSVAFSVALLEGAQVSVSPGVAFGPGGDAYVRFSLIEDVPRIVEACRRIRSFLAR